MPDELIVPDPDGGASVVRHWPTTTRRRAAVHVLHGWGEHAARYDRLADALTKRGYEVYADDHHAHGETGARSDTLGVMGPRGQMGAIDAWHAVTTHVRNAHPDVPLVVLGHSWGSMMLQRFLREWGAEIDAAVLSGTTRMSAEFLPPEDFNEGFERRTQYDWLSRDHAEVDKYIADPWCGFEMMQPGTELDVIPLAFDGDDANIPKALPILIVNGELDPIGGARGGKALADHYRALGIADVTFHCYPAGRHELFNDTNRDEVTADVLTWLDQHTG